MDLIDRKAAIDALISEGRSVDSRYISAERIIHEDDAIEAISMLPSVERNVFRVEKMEMAMEGHGEWVEQVAETDDNVTFDVFKCSQCGHLFSWPYAMKYCCNCGTKMDCIQGRDGRIDLWETVGDSE